MLSQITEKQAGVVICFMANIQTSPSAVEGIKCQVLHSCSFLSVLSHFVTHVGLQQGLFSLSIILLIIFLIDCLFPVCLVKPKEICSN